MKKDLDFNHDEFRNVSDDCKKFISKFLKKDPLERIALEDAVKDKYLEQSIEPVTLNLSEQKLIVSKISDFAKSNMFTKAIKLCMSKIYENSNFSDLRKKFMEYDTNHNGVLERDEFTAVMRTFDFSDEEINIMLTSLDLNNDGQIEFSEFISGCANFDSSNMFVAAELIFNIMDKDNSGKIDFDEFKKFFTQQNIKYEMTEVENVFKEMDEDGDGTVDIGEFSKKFKQ